jgi:drug/metabolite transporter (DMT)-like permease
MTPRTAGTGSGIAAMICVGSSVAVSTTLIHAPLLTAQAVRYTAAAVLLYAMARATGRRVPAPRGREWAWLIGVVVTGVILFNIAVVRGVEHAEPAVLAVAVACVPIVLALLGPLLEHARPTRRLTLAAAVVTGGGALVQGAGHADALGLGWAALALACEAAFTLLAVPVIGRLGAWGVAVHTTWISAVLLAGLGLGLDGPAAITRLDSGQLAAIGYLAVVVTALAFVLWYRAVAQLGAGSAGLLTGVAPVAAAAGGVLLGAPAPALGVWIGIAVVAVGLALGLTTPTPAEHRPTRQRLDVAPGRDRAVRGAVPAQPDQPHRQAPSAAGARPARLRLLEGARRGVAVSARRRRATRRRAAPPLGVQSRSAALTLGQRRPQGRLF